MDVRVEPGATPLNLSPQAFHLWARQYLQARHDFRAPERFSPVPYHLLCLAIELELKARHLQAKTQPEVKDSYGHDLAKSYRDLVPAEQTLTADEAVELVAASKVYKRKGFEYWLPRDALTGFSAFPDLDALDIIAAKLIRGHGSAAASV